MRKTRGLCTGKVRITSLGKGKFEEVRKELERVTESTRNAFKASNFRGLDKRRTLAFDVTYGPVVGGWRSDIAKYLERVKRETGITSEYVIEDFRREALPMVEK